MTRSALALLACLWLTACIAKAGPFVFAIGEAESCTGGYAYSDEAGWRCKGDFIAGAAISDTGARAIGVVGDAAVRVGTALGGAPIAVPPRPPREATEP